jgi:phage terminase large subunit GpA-like protein
LPAVEFYLENKEQMDAGVELLADNYKAIFLKDGTQVVHSAVQEVYNKISDTNLAAFKTEYQNDPPIESGPQGSGLDVATITSRTGNYGQGELPDTTRVRTVAIDLGNYKSHWVDVAWEGNAIGSVIDYGILKTFGLDARSDNKAIELALLDMLERWADEVVASINPIICLIDSGSGRGHTAAVYEFCRRRGRPFFPSKGWASSRFRMPAKEPNVKEPFLETWAHNLASDRVWLYNVHTEWWKPWVHQRFLTDPFRDDGMRNDGSLTLFDPNGVRNYHNLFANHIIAEGEQTLNGKTKFEQFSDNNHYLDAMALACAGAGSVGIKLIENYQAPVQQSKPAEPRRKFVNQFGQPFLATER